MIEIATPTIGWTSSTLPSSPSSPASLDTFAVLRYKNRKLVFSEGLNETLRAFPALTVCARSGAKGVKDGL